LKFSINGTRTHNTPTLRQGLFTFAQTANRFR
jgi:hypothetical protein